MKRSHPPDSICSVHFATLSATRARQHNLPHPDCRANASLSRDSCWGEDRTRKWVEFSTQKRTFGACITAMNEPQYLVHHNQACLVIDHVRGQAGCTAWRRVTALPASQQLKSRSKMSQNGGFRQKSIKLKVRRAGYGQFQLLQSCTSTPPTHSIILRAKQQPNSTLTLTRIPP